MPMIGLGCISLRRFLPDNHGFKSFGVKYQPLYCDCVYQGWGTYLLLRAA